MKTSKNGKIDVFFQGKCNYLPFKSLYWIKIWYRFNQSVFCVKIKNIAKMIVYSAILRHCVKWSQSISQKHSLSMKQFDIKLKKILKIHFDHQSIDLRKCCRSPPVLSGTSIQFSRGKGNHHRIAHILIELKDDWTHESTIDSRWKDHIWSIKIRNKIRYFKGLFKTGKNGYLVFLT